MNSAWTIADNALAVKGRSFHWARRLLGKVHAQRATRLYGFCRMVDDLADLAVSKTAARSALEEIKSQIISGQSSNAATRDMLCLMAECGIEHIHVLELINGVSRDLEAVNMQTTEELLHYCYQVAGVVGLMMCRVLDVKETAASSHAVSLGIAMQLTNICRDVKEDASGGRLYLPASLIGTIDPKDVAEPSAESKLVVRAAVSQLLKVAALHYESGEIGLPYLPVRARASILVAARIYRAIGYRLRDCDYAVWRGRVFVTGPSKARITARALIEATVSSSFWRSPKPSNPEIFSIRSAQHQDERPASLSVMHHGN